MSGKKKQPPMRMQNVFIFLLLAIFAISAIFLTALGARIYRETVDTSNQNNTARIVTAIIRGAVQSDDTGIVSVTEEDGLPILLFTNDYDGETYYRRIYCADGYLRDCLVSAELEFEKDLGDPLVEADSFEPVIRDHMLTVKIRTPDGGEQEVCVYLRAGGAAE